MICIVDKRIDFSCAFTFISFSLFSERKIGKSRKTLESPFLDSDIQLFPGRCESEGCNLPAPSGAFTASASDQHPMKQISRRLYLGLNCSCVN